MPEMPGGDGFVVAPEAESVLLEDPASYWRKFRTARYHDYAAKSSKVPVRPVRVDRKVKPGDRFEFEGLKFEVLGTPGPTAGAVSYLTDEGGKRVAYAGDLIAGGGRLIDLWSLQDAVPEAKLRGYHGYAARAGSLIESLRKLQSLKLDRLVPARGPAIDNPDEAIETTIVRLKEVIREHFTTDALRWYFGDDNHRLRAAKLLEGIVPEAMPMAETMDLPPWIRDIRNSRLLISESKAAFLTDCGYDRVIEEVQTLMREGVISKLEGIFVTHYHDDHTDRVQRCAETFQCPVYYERRTSPILENPPAYYMPCLTTEPIRAGVPKPHGAQWRWREFRMTIRDFPGQTFYHDALLAERDGGGAVFFVGDSFTPSGMDDYCLRNRNFLGDTPGYFECLQQIRTLPAGAYLINQHVKPMFRFSPGQLSQMEQSLARRRDALARLTLYPHPDFALDDQWVRLSPYESQVRDRRITLSVHVLNHAKKPLPFTLEPVLPEGWQSEPRRLNAQLPPGKESVFSLAVAPPKGATGFHVLACSVRLGEIRLREYAEALVDLG